MTSRWRLAGLLCGGLLAMSALLLLLAGTGEEGIRMWIRATARTSLVLFLATFVARPLRTVWRHRASGWLLAQRRYLGASAAFSHFLHLLGIVRLATAHAESYQVDPVTLVVGGLGFAFFFAMGLTSSDAAVAALGRTHWRRLHRTGAWYLWFVFLVSYLPDGGAGPIPWTATAALLLAVGLRVFVFARSRAGRAPRAGLPA